MVSSWVVGMLPSARLMSWAVLAEAVRVLTQRVRPELRTCPLTSTSTNTSTLPPTSPLLLKPIHRCAVVSAVRVALPLIPAGGVHVPMVTQGLPPLNARPAESLVLAVRLSGGMRSAVKVGGLAVPPLPCR